MTTAGSGAQQGNASSASAGEKKSINAELWQTCAGPLVNLPSPGTHVVYFPQGHSEQVAASMKKDVDAQIPNYSNLPSKLLCILHNITLQADPDTDEVYAQMTLQPVNSFDKDDLLRSDLSMRVTKPQTEFFCKTLTASDTSTHGGFSVPRRAAEKIFPQLDFTMQPPTQELTAKDLHDNVWTFRHIYRGQPKRHLLTTGWSHFVSGKRLFAGDSVLFIRDEKQQLLLGIRRANRQPTNLSSSVLSSDSMHIGILAAAAHAAANNSPFTVFYNPRASPSEFVIPLAKYYKAVCNNHISSGMRFRMLFETEESGTRRYMGTITGVSDLDPVRWKNSQWRNLQVGWDESIAGEKRNRVSIWEIEPITAPFFLCPTPPIFGSKRPRLPGMLDDGSPDLDNLYRRNIPWLGDEFGLKDTHVMPGLSLAQWMNMKQNPSLTNPMQPNFLGSLPGSVLPDLVGADISRQLGLPSLQMPQQNNLQFGNQRPKQAVQQQLDQLQKLSSSTENPVGSIVQPLQQLTDITQQARHNTSQTLPTSQVHLPVLQQQCLVPTQNVLPHQPSLVNHQLHSNLSQNMPQQQQQSYHQPVLSHPQQHNLMPSQSADPWPGHVTADQVQLQLLQKLHQQQQSQLAQLSAGLQQPSQVNQLQDQQKQLLDTTASNLPKSASASQMLDASQTTLSVHPQLHATQQISQSNLKIAQLPQQPKPQQQQLQPGLVSELPGHVSHTINLINNQPSAGSSSLLTGAAGAVQSPVSDDAPSCSTSPSTNNCPNVIQSVVNDRNQQTATRRDEIARSSAPLLNSTGLESMSSSAHLVKALLQKSDVHPLLNTSKSQNQNPFGSQAYHNGTGAQIDYVDSSSVTSVLSQNDAHQMLAVNNSISFNPILFRDASQDGEVQDDPRSSVPFGATVENHFGMPMLPESMINRKMMESGKGFTSDVSCGGGMVSGYQNPKDAQPEFSSSVVPQPFGVPDMTFNSIDPTVDGGFMNAEAWAPPQIPRMRTYTKVYKRGAVGRSIDIARYSGYDELKQDLARRFGIEGQLEDKQKIGWKLVYVDHENDVLLVGDDPWEEFVNCVRCIKILSPQEVQQMSLDDGGSILPTNQACGSSDNGLS